VNATPHREALSAKILTENERKTKVLASEDTSNDVSCVGDSIGLGVVQLEVSDNTGAVWLVSDVKSLGRSGPSHKTTPEKALSEYSHMTSKFMTKRRMTPGAIPTSMKTKGIDRTPRPMLALVIRTKAPIGPT